MKRFTVRVATLVIAVAMLTPLVSPAHADSLDCNNRSNTFARFLQPASGQATVNAGPAGTYTLSSGGPVPSVTLSFTGTMDVVIEYSCLRTMGLTVTKDDPTGGPATVVHTAAWKLECEHATKTEPVTIGLTGGQYHFALDAISCTGIGFKHTPEGGLVGDPPLL